jgi:hypothetical protein
MSFAYYLSADCGNCDEEIFYGVCVTLLEHNDLPVIPITTAEQTSFHCDRCGATNYTGDVDLFTEGGTDPDDLADDESDDDAETEVSA